MKSIKMYSLYEEMKRIIKPLWKEYGWNYGDATIKRNSILGNKLFTRLNLESNNAIFFNAYCVEYREYTDTITISI